MDDVAKILFDKTSRRDMELGIEIKLIQSQTAIRKLQK